MVSTGPDPAPFTKQDQDGLRRSLIPQGVTRARCSAGCRPTLASSDVRSWRSTHASAR